MVHFPKVSPGTAPGSVAAGFAMLALALTLVLPAVVRAAPNIPETPLVATQAAIPLSMMVVGRDHTLFFEAYNDASDIDGDGTLDIRFKPQITYYGLFDSTLCYTHSGGSDNSGLFTPVDMAGVLGTCSGQDQWSGNWLNYVTTSRIDALRKVFYGGYREIDKVDSTVLRRAYIPQDAHSWAKEYSSEAIDGYNISNYTPLNLPTSNRRHFFGNVTMNGGTNCATLNNCSNLEPFLSVVTNSAKRVWDWASSESPVLNNSTHGGTRTNYTVRVAVCTETYNDGCKRYPNGSLKPVGLLHEYGENDAMMFGLLTGSYNRNMSGGVLRKVVSSFKSEVIADTGLFSADATIVTVLNNLRIRDFNNGKTNAEYRKKSFRTDIMNEGDYVDWGNPIGEMMYEALRYFAGKSAPTTAFFTSGLHDEQVGLPVADWDDPYHSASAASAQWCARPNLLVVSSTNVSYDSDQLPGSAFVGFSSDLEGLNVRNEADKITAGEPDVPGSRFIGAVGNNEDYAPTAKPVTTLGNLRGLSPEEPTKQGSYYSASVAHFGRSNDLNPVKGDQTTDTYVVALASPLPKLEFNVSGKVISLVPFAKTIDNLGAVPTKGKYQPTNPIVDFYIEEYAANRVKFRINYEADEQGNDYDMDVIVQYEIEVNPDGKLSVKVKPTFESTGSNQNLGYVISGTDRDGVYLVAQDKNESINYFLNVPPGRSAGYCDADPFPAGCDKLPWISAPAPGNESVQLFAPGGTTAATILENPLWFAAKWGGFRDRNSNGVPDLQMEWDSDNDSVPDTYFFVQNPLNLKESLKRSFDTIVERSASAGNITSNGQQLQSESRVFQTQFNSGNWTGELFAFDVTASGVNLTPTWRGSNGIPLSAERKVFTWKDSVTKGVPFEWIQLTLAQQDSLGTKSVLDYLRGDQSNEIQNAGVFRTRAKLLGDIVHSSPYYVKDTNTVYVGGNDGMLHAFEASSGSELFAYIPGLVFSKLGRLAAPSYDHTFFVDGDITVTTRSQTPGKNILIASAGRGARGIFALDVSSPGTFGTGDVLWEYDGSVDDDFGFVTGRPQIATLENGDTVVLVSNGHNSVSGKSVLYVFALEDGELLKKMELGEGPDNGLSTSTTFDADTNGAIDTVYAGDIKGNVWRLDFGGNNPSNWVSEFGTQANPVPLFTALDSLGIPQPITAQLSVALNTEASDPYFGKRYILFGTGSYVYASDPNDKQVQSWYGVIDGKIDENDSVFVGTRSNLVERRIDTLGTVSGVDVRVFSEASVNDMVGKKGWFVDLKDPTARGERIVTRSLLFRFLEPVLIASSIIPDPDPCEAGGSGFVNAINPFTGARLAYSPFDLNDDGKFGDLDTLTDGTVTNAVVGSFNPRIGMPGEVTLIGDRLVVGGSTGEIADMRTNLGLKRTGRISWRELIGD